MRLLISGGGTGGHLVPGLNLARELRGDGVEVQLALPGRAVERQFVRRRGQSELRVHELPVSRSRFALPLMLSRHILPARKMLARERIDIVVGLGGGGSLPCLIAAATQRIPFVLLEQNVVPGRATKLMGRFAQRVYTSFPETQAALRKSMAIATGMPLRPGLGYRGDPATRKRYAGDAQRLIVVLGGSQGASSLNRCLPRVFQRVDAAAHDGVAVVHISGPGKEDETRRAYAEQGLRATVLPFVDDMAPFYAIADLVVCRGGGTTLVEVAAAGRPAVVVPYPWHKDKQQFHNANWFASRGAMRVLDHSQLEVGFGAEIIDEVLADSALRSKMGEIARNALPRDGGPRIARDVLSLARAASYDFPLESRETVS